MRLYPTRSANTNKENGPAAKLEGSSMRVTRAQAKTASSSGGLPPLVPCNKQDQKRVLRPNPKRAASDENKPTDSRTINPRNKRRAVLKDVTNIVCKSSYVKSMAAAKMQPCKQPKKGIANNNVKVAADVVLENPQVEKDVEERMIEETTLPEAKTLQETSLPVSVEKKVITQSSKNKSGATYMIYSKKISKGKSSERMESLDAKRIIMIDSNKDPQMCSLYAADIYHNFCATELDRRPLINYMEIVQRDISQLMRSILVDWLVEVSEEYKLVPDTLYLTVNLIDRFLSGNYIEKQKLQLLGVTCMLIASKYEEICAPHVEDFCFITDNTYTRKELLDMESQVLNFLGFQLSVPTTKKFLRRFIQAAHASSKAPSVELEFLSNYLAELTLSEYNFLTFLPSRIAASAVFLARWMLDQSNHPWNPTLEHYTSYNATQLQATVLALQELQLNTNGCSSNAVREKYKQQKFKSVASLSSWKPVESLF